MHAEGALHRMSFIMPLAMSAETSGGSYIERSTKKMIMELSR